MDFFEAIEKRYSHKETFLPDPVPLADLERIAHAGLTAPSGANLNIISPNVITFIKTFYSIKRNIANCILNLCTLAVS